MCRPGNKHSIVAWGMGLGVARNTDKDGYDTRLSACSFSIKTVSHNMNLGWQALCVQQLSSKNKDLGTDPEGNRPCLELR